jgi:hypothetical protein
MALRNSAIDLCAETIVVGFGLPTPDCWRTSQLQGKGLSELKGDLGELRGVLEQVESPASLSDAGEDQQRFANAHTRLKGHLEGITTHIDNLTQAINETPKATVISHTDSDHYTTTLRKVARDSRGIINAASSGLGEFTEVTDAGRAAGLSESMLAMIRTVANVARERIVATMRGVRGEVRESLINARRFERELSSSGVGLTIVDMASGAFQISTPIYGVTAARGTEAKPNRVDEDPSRTESRRELNDLIAAKVVVEQSKASQVALRAKGFLARLDAVCESGIIPAIVSGRILDVVPFVGNRRIERRIADESAALARYVKREKELMKTIGDSAVLSA